MNAMTNPEFDAALVARYDVPGPRYTSYPTAPQFHAGFGGPQLRAAIRDSNEAPIPDPLSLYIHIPFCASPCFYCGCNRIITRDVARADRYLERLYREIELTAPLFDRDRTVSQVHFGGGTPNFLDAPRMRELMDCLRGHFGLDRDGRCEIGIEIDPRFADGDYIRALGGMGFNRISVGIQDFDPDVQQAVNRIQSVAQTRAVLDAARESGYRSANVDLIYGLPRQSLAGFARTLDTIVDLAPDRVAVYGYAHLPNLFKAQRQIRAAELPDAMTRLQLLGLAIDRLGAAGFSYIGMDHFARADDELVAARRAGTLQRNFQGYSTHGECDIVGLGVSAISRIGPTYSQNARDLPGYYMAIDNGRLPVARGIALDADDIIRRAAINHIMCDGHIDLIAFGQRHHIEFNEYFGRELGALRELADDGLVEVRSDAIAVTPRGHFLLRSIAMCFDAWLDGQATTPRYSRTV